MTWRIDDIPLVSVRSQPLDSWGCFRLACMSAMKLFQDPKKYSVALLKSLLLRAVEYVPFYRDMYNDSDFNAKDICNDTIEVLKSFPVINKQTILRYEIKSFLSSYFTPADLIRNRTSGSSGQHFDFIFDKISFNYLNMVRIRSQLLAGLRPWHKALILAGDEKTPTNNRCWYNKIGMFRIYYIGGFESPSYIYNQFERVKPDIIITYPSLLMALKPYLTDKGIQLACSQKTDPVLVRV